jgi:hypothetical protein
LSDGTEVGTVKSRTGLTITFDGGTSNGVLTWMEDEDHLKFSDDAVMDAAMKLYFHDEGGESSSRGERGEKARHGHVAESAAHGRDAWVPFGWAGSE